MSKTELRQRLLCPGVAAERVHAMQEVGDAPRARQTRRFQRHPDAGAKIGVAARSAARDDDFAVSGGFDAANELGDGNSAVARRTDHGVQPRSQPKVERRKSLYGANSFRTNGSNEALVTASILPSR